MIIYFRGGIYCDADCYINKKFNEDINSNIILFTEGIVPNVNRLGPRESKNLDNVLRVANYFFVSKFKKHPFFKAVIAECLKRLKRILIKEKKTIFNRQDILWCCGPDVITTIYHLTKHKYNDIHLHDKSFLDHRCYNSWKKWCIIKFLKI